MKYRVVVAPEVIRNLDDIFERIAEDNPRAAAKLVEKLGRKIRALYHTPRRCPYAPEHGVLEIAEVRHLLYGRYRIIFGIEGKTVIILEIRHSARLPTTK